MKKCTKLLLEISFIFGLFILTGCATVKPTVKEEVVIRYVDSIAWHDSTVFVMIPVEIYKDYTSMLDTLNLESSVAKSQAYLDTTSKTLKGTIENKPDSIKTIIKWKEKIVYKDTFYIKDTIVVPKEVKKEVTRIPSSYWWFLGFSVICVIYFIIKIYLKIKL